MLESKKLTTLIAVNDKTIGKKLATLLKKDVKLHLASIKHNFYEIERSIHSSQYDLILADVELGTEQQPRVIFEILKSYNNEKKRPPIILFSHKRKWASKAYFYGALDFITYPAEPDQNPVKPARLTKALTRYHNLINATASQFVLNRRLLFHQRGNQIFLDFKEIVFIMSNGKKSIIHTAEEKFEVFILLKELQTFLQELGFVRLHKRYIVNSHYIKSFNQSGERDKVARVDHKEIEHIPIGRSYYKQLVLCEYTTMVC